MRGMSWSEYYDSFWDWATSTQIAYIKRLTDYGPADEVAEVAYELGNPNCNDLIEKAFEAGVRFTPQQVIDLSDVCGEDVLSMLARHTTKPFSAEEQESIYCCIDENAYKTVCKRSGFDAINDIDEPDEEFDDFEPEPRPPRLGFFATLGLMLGLSSHIGDKDHHPGYCTGDCAHCPPHYGYRYGRWYYGHDHQYGCEFGGNKGSGGMI